MPEAITGRSGLDALLEQARTHLDHQRLRQRVRLANIANADTPGYRAREVIESQIANDSALTRTERGHLGGEPLSALTIIERSDGQADASGNNVELDEELAGLAEVALDIRVTTRSLTNVLALYRAAATEVR
ncbi:MAG: hypothetical protein D6761_08615 [Candidatus Dadabacteria bacterium]|nr:MAG: hypothetical protein D6761_08615 [Candidatus Dadabacteria bacterium]